MRRSGRRIRELRDPELDRWSELPDGVRHDFVDTDDGARLHVAQLGDGPPVLLLHGVGLGWQIWAAQMTLLAPAHRVIAWDMRGHGQSSVGHDGVNLAAVAGDVVSVLEAMDLRDVVLVGHSMGGMALGRCAVEHRDALVERSRALMFLATSAAMVDRESLGGVVVALADKVAKLNRDGARFHYPWGDNDLSAVLIRSVFGRRVSANMIDGVRRMFEAMDPSVTVACGRSIASHDVRRGLGGLPMPCSVVVGSADRLTSLSHAKVLDAALGRSELHVVDGSGHQVMQEAPEQLSAMLGRLAGA